MAIGIARLERFGAHGPEGHFIYLFAGPLNRIAKGEFNDNSILRTEGVPATVLAAFRALVNQLYSGRADPSDTVWIDKTPDLAQVRAVPVINRLWPDARYIYLYRQPAAAVRSNLALWPAHVTGRESDTAQRWVDCQRTWRAVRKQLGNRFVEVFQPEMLAAPQDIAAMLQPLLDLSDKETNTLSQIWTMHPTLNRPVGARGEAYDSVVLTKSVAEEVAAITGEEAAHWPKIASADAP